MGGRSSISELKVTVFGCTGFVGRYLVNRLGRIGSQVVVPYRGNEYDMMHLKPLADLGQIVPMAFHLKDQQSLVQAVKHSNVVVNLIAQDRPTRNFSLRDVHVEGPLRIARACQETGVSKLIHVSTAQAAVNAQSALSRSRAEGEAALRHEFPESVIVRPSVLFGHEDRFLHAIGTFTLLPLGFPIVDGGKALRSPLYVGDLAEALTRLCQLDANAVAGQTFDLPGPHQYTMQQVIRLFSYLALRPSKTINMPTWLLWLYARLYPEWRRPLFTRDLIRNLAEDEVSFPGAKGWRDVGMDAAGDLKTLETHALPFVRCYRHTEDFVKVLPNPDPPRLQSSSSTSGKQLQPGPK